ncbi:CdaR family transcriptional regulator [Alkalihalobacillus pseudalcaliphilus]|uniref:CdaR family transcriptional regulator n=1 Tax=Alkalihalobacillus pseudalcaliphilus TaxID=79884 RepID=UPI00064D81C2|nr:sugar diacid recognition domain-containing protein [Alkalihalobacillus pseudalcaliphilus]KMK75119.1 hypothetical protein AB990_16855 [Alkalihalobacillus pseudalcaliphilus]
MLTQELAQDIVTQTILRLNRNINIMDESGTIIASANPERLNQIHHGAVEVLRSGQTVFISEQNHKRWGRALPGVNLPIEFKGKIVGVIGITGKPEEVIEFGELVKMNTEIMLNQAYLMEQMEWKQRLKDEIFHSIIKSPTHFSSHTDKLELLKMTVKPPYQVVILDLYSSTLRRNQLMDLLEPIFPSSQTFIGFISMSQIYILTTGLEQPATNSKINQAIERFTRKDISIRIGIGRYYHDEHNIRSSYHEALAALKLGDKNLSIISFSQVMTQSLLSQIKENKRQTYYEHILAGLNDKLIETLYVYFKNNLSISKTSASMYIHRNSLIYRLRKIETITGYNPQTFQDATILQVAIWMKRIANH